MERLARILLMAWLGTGCSGETTTLVATCYKDGTVGASGEVYMIADGAPLPIVADGTFPEHIDTAKHGSRICYSRGKDENSEIYVRGLRSGRETRVTENRFCDYNPNLSPDGREVVYWSIRENGIQLYLSRVDGTNERNILNRPDVYAFDPEWSHDGSMIAFNVDQEKTGCRSEIFVGILNEERTGFADFFSVTDTLCTCFEADPAWSPDDSRLVYSVYDGPGCWQIEGLQEPHRRFWKIRTLEVDREARCGRNATTIWESDGRVINWLPIWTRDEEGIVVIQSELLDLPDFPFGSRSRLVRYQVETRTETPLAGTENCFFFDCL